MTLLKNLNLFNTENYFLCLGEYILKKITDPFSFHEKVSAVFLTSKRKETDREYFGKI